MTQARRTTHRMDMMHELERMQTDMTLQWLDQSLPDDWTGLEWEAPVGRHKTRITLRVDTDMLKWFRKLGPGYQARINRVLRVYWTALLAGHIKAYPHDHTVPRLQNELQRVLDDMKARRGKRDDDPL